MPSERVCRYEQYYTKEHAEEMFQCTFTDEQWDAIVDKWESSDPYHDVQLSDLLQDSLGIVAGVIEPPKK